MSPRKKCLLILLVLAAVPSSVWAEEPTQDALTIFDQGFAFDCSHDKKVGCSGILPAHPGGDSEPPSEAAPLTGRDSLAARLQSLVNAKHSIRIEALEFAPDESGTAIARILEEKADKGIPVQVVVDAVSNHDRGTTALYDEMKAHGVQVIGAFGHSTRFDPLYEARFRDPVTLFRSINDRFHDKMWVVDEGTPDAVAIVGGMNVGNRYFRIATDDTKNRWTDQDLIVRGPIVSDITATFDRNVAYHRSLAEQVPVPVCKAISAVAVVEQKLLKHWVEAARELDPAKEEMVDEAVSRKLNLQWTPAPMRFIQSRPRMKESYIEQAYLQEINSARSEITLMNAYFLPTRKIRAALEAAVERGVKVTILTNSKDSSSEKGVVELGRPYYAEMLASAQTPEAIRNGGTMSIREWVGEDYDEGNIHAKFGIFDHKDLIVGSFNLDPRSANLNSETAMAVQSPALAERLLTRFVENDVPKSTEVTPEQAQKWKSPALPAKIVQKVKGKLFRGLY